VEHKTALRWAVERVSSVGDVHLVAQLLDFASTSRCRSSARHRADSVEHLLHAVTSRAATRRPPTTTSYDVASFNCSPTTAAGAAHTSPPPPPPLFDSIAVLYSQGPL